MEHRLYHRSNDHFDVTLSSPRHGNAIAHVHDISHEGIAVHLDEMPFPLGTLVEVVLPEEQQQRFHNHGGIRGYVVHAKEGEVGLWLLEPNDLI